MEPVTVTFGAIVSAIVGVAKAIPVVANLLDQLTDAWVMKDIADVKEDQMTKSQQRKALMKTLIRLKEEDNAERKAISIAINNFHNK